jgi:hypothetical protein
VVPRGTTVYFFTKDGQLLGTEGSDFIMDMLCKAQPDEQAVRNLAVEVRGPFETCPNYTAYGSNDFRDPTGVYTVGLPIATGLFASLPDGTEKKLSNIIGGQGKGGVIGSAVYWLACRDAPTMSNNVEPKQVATLDDGNGNQLNMTGALFEGDTGLKPSLVKQAGKWI